MSETHDERVETGTVSDSEEAAEAAADEESIWSLSKRLAGKGAKGVEHTYERTRSAVTQEAAWTEVTSTVETLVDIVCAQHALLLELTERVNRLAGDHGTGHDGTAAD